MSGQEASDLVEALASFPSRVGALLAALDPAGVSRRPAPGEWSPAEVFAHVRASDAILAPRIFQLLIRPGCFLAGFDERAWAGVAARASLPVEAQLQGFTAARGELTGVLRSLAPEEWQIEGEHEERGRVTVAWLARYIAEHEAEHGAQLEAILDRAG